MPKPVDYDLSQISTHVITYSDRIQRGTKEDRATPACTAALAEAGLGPVSIAAIPESADILETEIREALEAGARFILVLGGSGFGVGNYAPEVVRSIVEVEIPGIAEQIRAHGLTNTPLSGLSREVVGVTARDSSGALIVSSPGSRGGALDTLEVVTPSRSITPSRRLECGDLAGGPPPPDTRNEPGRGSRYSHRQGRCEVGARERHERPFAQDRSSHSTTGKRRPPASIRGGRRFMRMVAGSSIRRRSRPSVPTERRSTIDRRSPACR